jgi:putative heme-binding domain-containing protein
MRRVLETSPESIHETLHNEMRRRRKSCTRFRRPDSRAVLFAFAILVSIFLSPGAAVSQDKANSVPAWIWSSTQRKPKQTCELSHEFEPTGRVTEARLRLVSDFCQTSVRLNKKTIAIVDAYGPWLDIDVSDQVRRGTNRVEISSLSSAGPAAVAASLTLTFADGKQQTIVTDASWLAGQDKSVQATSFGAVASELWNSETGTSAFDDYTQWKQASGGSVKPDPATFAVRPGFTIEHVRTAKDDEDSWVSMAFDPAGRLTIAKEKRGLLRLDLTPTEDDPRVTKVETINDTLLECRGLLYAHGALYANANNSKGLYRLRDTTGDGGFNEVKLLREFPGRVGHGRNDLALGRDGMIYSIHGDAVQIPTENILDRTSPFRAARQGKPTTEGHLIRTDKDGRKWELLSAGLRNPFGIAFNSAGDLFTYDADAEHDMGAPWYRPTRIDHLSSGADFGWRGRTGEWPPYYPDHADNSFPSADIGKGSPTALCSGLRTNFPGVYRRALFVLDWTYGRILACHQIPRGAGWLCRTETFLKGRPLNVTDIAVGPDGCLYIITGGRGTESSLYRIRYTGPTTNSPRAMTQQQRARQEFSERQRELRRKLESFHGVTSPEAIDLAWSHLGSPDPVLRHAARVAIEHQPPESWADRALAEKNWPIAVTVSLSLARSGNEKLFPAILNKVTRLPLGKLSSYDTLSAVRAMALSIADPTVVDPAAVTNTRQFAAAWLALMLTSPRISPTGAGGSVHRELARLSLPAESEDALNLLIVLMDQAKSQSDRMHYLYLLRNQNECWTEESRRIWFEALRDLDRTVIGGAGMPDFLKQIRTEATATLNDKEKKQLGDLLKPGNENPESQLTINRPLVREWTLADLDELLTVPANGPDPANGRKLFEAALCSRCHRLGFRGGVTGPDLTSVATRFSRRDILTSILYPSRIVAGKYRNAQIVTSQGKTIVGRVVTGGDYRSPNLKIATDPLRPSQVIEVSKSDIDIHQDSMLSPMPKGLLNTLSKNEILDLLAALQSAQSN